MTDPTDAKCPLCRQPARRTEVGMKDVYKFAECHCGSFFVEHCDYEDYLGEGGARIDDDDRLRLSALLRENLIRGHRPLYLQFGVAEYPAVPSATPRPAKELLHSEWPRTVPERVDRTLCNLGQMSREPGQDCPLLMNNPAVAFARSNTEAAQHERYLCDEGYIEITETGNIALTFKGWRRFEELTAAASASTNPAFVAMWFGDDKTRPQMTSLYRDALEPAIEKAGFRARRADTEEHNDFIMDEILASIRMAPFVVADFTGNRGGVYLEAGFARGLGLQVIHSCRRDDFKDAHFDIQQLNTIQWSDPAELKEPLYHRILWTIGEGPFRKAETPSEKESPR